MINFSKICDVAEKGDVHLGKAVMPASQTPQSHTIETWCEVLYHTATERTVWEVQHVSVYIPFTCKPWDFSRIPQNALEKLLSTFKKTVNSHRFNPSFSVSYSVQFLITPFCCSNPISGGYIFCFKSQLSLLLSLCLSLSVQCVYATCLSSQFFTSLTPWQFSQ